MLKQYPSYANASMLVVIHVYIVLVASTCAKYRQAISWDDVSSSEMLCQQKLNPNIVVAMILGQLIYLYYLLL